MPNPMWSETVRMDLSSRAGHARIPKMCSKISSGSACCVDDSQPHKSPRCSESEQAQSVTYVDRAQWDAPSRELDACGFPVDG